NSRLNLLTDQEILEAQKLIAEQIAGMRDDLALISATTDEEKLPALVLEKVPCRIESIRHIPWTILSGPERQEWFHDPLSIWLALAEMAHRRPDYKATANAVA